MSSSSRVISRVLRGEAGRQATAETFSHGMIDASPGTPAPAAVDPFVATRLASYREGYEAGLAVAANNLETMRAEQARALADALVAAATAARSHRQEAVAQAEREAVELAFELAEALVGHEISITPSQSIDAVRRAVALVPRGEDLVVRLHPDDVISPEDLQGLVPDASVKVVVDPDVEPGGCVVDAGPCRIDAQIGPAMARARELIDTVAQEPRGSA